MTAAPVYGVAQFLDDPHVQERGIVVEVPDDEMGEVPRLGRTPGVFRAPAPTVGQHNDEVYGRIGYSADRRQERKVI